MSARGIRRRLVLHACMIFPDVDCCTINRGRDRADRVLPCCCDVTKFTAGCCVSGVAGLRQWWR